jgi:V/A-type H+-transporting ATPase subunit K
LILSISAVVVTIFAGIVMYRRGFRGSRKIFVCIAAASFCVLLIGALLPLASNSAAVAAESAEAETAKANAPDNGLAYIAMALVTGLGCIAAGIAVASVGPAAIGLIGEQPGAVGTTLIYVGLAEGIAIYGIVVSILILNKLG